MKSNTMMGLLPVFVASLLWQAPVAVADNKAQIGEKISAIHQERERLQAERKRLEGQLGKLGRELGELDSQLVNARDASRTVEADVKTADQKLASLHGEQKEQREKVVVLQKRMLAQSVAAYQRGNRRPGWLDAMAGVPVTEIPHRKYMLQQLIESQAGEQRAYLAAVSELERLEKLLQIQRDALAALHRQKLERETELARAVEAKRELMRSVHQDANLQAQRDRELARQEQALQRLLSGFGLSLPGEDKVAKVSMRKQKGRLKWPLKGRVVAGFGTELSSGHGKLAGVQLAPYGRSRQVHAVSAGRVRYADWFGGYGLMLIVDHGEGLVSIYAHNDRLFKQLGDWIETGELLAEAGNTGWVESVRLYFELRDRTKPVDPAKWCRR